MGAIRIGIFQPQECSHNELITAFDPKCLNCYALSTRDPTRTTMQTTAGYAGAPVDMRVGWSRRSNCARRALRRQA